MTSLKNLLLVAVSSVAMLAGSGVAQASVQAEGRTVSASPSDPWPQASSDIPADVAARFGTLSNGMRYVILHNATPPGQAALRMRIDAGSLAERDDQKGLAHFLEHMAFNGSTHIPEGEMTRRLERLGLAFGGDTNAMTNFDQTAYLLNLPNGSDEVVDASLMALREVAGELLLAPDAIDRERGVVVGEERMRDTPASRSLNALLPFLAPGQRLSDRIPIGDLDIIRKAPRDLFVDFYRAYYRPERATLIAVGDFDVDKMETKIRSAFEDWVNAAPDGADPDLGQVQTRQAETRIHVEPGAQSLAQIFWTSPHTPAPDTVAERRKALVRSLGLAVLNRRFAAISRAENPPFLGGGGGYQELFDSLDAGTVVVAFNPGGWSRAIQTAEQEQRRLIQYGVGQGELDREATEYRTALQAAAAGAATRPTPALASELLNGVNGNDVFSSPAENLKLFDAAIGTVTVAEVNDAVRQAFSGNGPLVFVTTPVEIEGGETAVTAALQASRQVAVSVPVLEAVVQWPYSSFGTPGQPSGQSEVADLGVSFITFPNGVRLTVKPTTFTDKQILVSVRSGQGDLGLPSNQMTPLWAAPLVFTEGGLSRLTRTQIDQALAGRVVGVAFAGDQDAYQLSGATRPEDLALQMQLLAAYFTDAGWRPEPFAQIKGLYGQQLAQASATPAGAFTVQGAGLLANGDRRFGYPTPDEVAAADLADLRQRVRPSFGGGPVEIIVVGDVTVADAIAATAATFGALPARSAPIQPGADALRVRFPSPTAEPVQLHHTGAATQALGYVGWPSVDSIGDRKETRTVGLLARVLQLRVTDELREKQGIAYSPRASATTSTVFPDYGYIFVQVETPPEALPGFFDTVDSIAEGLREAPITEDELRRARLSSVEATRRGQATNAYWLGQLEGAQTDVTKLAAIRTVLSDIEAITTEDIQRAARTYLQSNRAWRAEVTAQPSPDHP